VSAVPPGTPSAYQIRNLLNHYRVARNFKGLSGKAHTISKAFLEVSSGEGDPSDKVAKLAKRFERSFGQLNLSAASKLLWLRERSPYRVYDARAADALRALGNEIEKADYRSSCETWQREYEPRSGEILLAASGLVNLPRNYTRDSSLSDDQLTKLVQAKWFRERVFDIYLWEIGSPKNAEAIRES
jgi:hypothetical protein